MPLRRVLVALLLVIVVMSFAASLSSHNLESNAPSQPSSRGQGALVQTVTATLPDDRVVRAAVGDRIELDVEAEATDQVQVAGYDLLEVVDPLAPAHFDFIADHAGRFRVTLLSSGKALGRLEVVERP
jgi:hypothetical protein